MIRARSWRLPAALVVLSVGSRLSAQTPASAPALPPLNFSGVLFGSYNFQQSTTPSPLPGQTDNAFVVDRAYLTFRMPAGDHGSIRLTTDAYNTTEGTPNGYTIRAKYAYFQYDVPKFSNGASFLGRIGILHNVVIDHEETFWPRYISQTAVERAGYFASSDVGLASQLTLPDKLGEVYATITNGNGYTARENNRFKDYAIRLSLTPLANSTDMPLLQTFTISAWGYKGATASAFVNGGAGPGGPGRGGGGRGRAGIFVWVKGPPLVAGGGVTAAPHEG